MQTLSARTTLGLAAVVDIALHAREAPVTAKALAARQGVAPRHFELVLQALVHHGILKGLRGPRGGYALARERRRITAGAVVRALDAGSGDECGLSSSLATRVVLPLVGEATEAFLKRLDSVTIDDLCRAAEAAEATAPKARTADFTI